MGTPTTIFVGAGASSIPPTSLPTWHRFTTLLLEVLLDRVADIPGIHISDALLKKLSREFAADALTDRALGLPDVDGAHACPPWWQGLV